MKMTKETKIISEAVFLQMESDRDNGAYLDTKIIIDGTFWVAGSQRIEFAEKLEELIDEYRI